MELRVIRDELQYAALLEQAKELALSDPLPNSEEAERLALISVLLEKFEETRFKLEVPDPIDAVIYRLAELGLKQKDFAEILGSKSRASEVLTRKRGLTIEMIRTIHERLMIPAEILIGHPKQEEKDASDIDWTKFPVREMQKRGWFDMDLAEGKSGEQLIRSFFARTSANRSPVLLRKTLNGVSKEENHYAIYAWIAMKGVILVIEPHLPKTKLDGAAMLDQDGTPIIGLTLRYDRIDYFWFTLMHELVHVQRHLGRQSTAFVDEDDLSHEDERELEANILAAEAFIPRQIWKSSEAYRTKRSEAVVKLANALMIHPAIVAGRIQRESGKYNILKEFASSQSIKSVFNLSAAGESNE